MAGFRVAATDEREGIFSSWPSGQYEKLQVPYKEALNTIAFHENCYIVVSTHLHDLDCEITAGCATKPHRYLGMIGSSRKVAIAKQRLEEEFRLSSETISRIDMPIGVPIACESPADIAVSILARLIDIKNSAKK
jgi:xanthine dehydrogenase accessory factor